VTAHLQFAPELGKLAEMDVKIPEIRLRDVGSRTGGSTLVANLSAVVIKAVLEAVVRKGGNLPGRIGADLRGGLSKLDGVGGEVVGQVTRIGGGVGEKVEGIVGGAVRGLGGLLGKEEKE
jgi:hypothetical protein